MNVQIEIKDKTPRVVPKTALFWVDRVSGWVKCRSPYSQEFIQVLKLQIPNEHRKWLSAEKVWAVSPIFAEAIINIASNFYDHIVELEEDPGEMASGTARSSKNVADVKSSIREHVNEVKNVLPEFKKRKVEV